MGKVYNEVRLDLTGEVMSKNVSMAAPPDIPDIQRVEGPVLTNAEAAAQSYENALLGVLLRIEKYIIAGQGKSPEFRVWEFPLAALGRHHIQFDIRPEKWVIWTRTPTTVTDTLRVVLGAFVPVLHAVEITAGYILTMPGMTSEIAFHNPSAQNALHVFCVAAGVGDFDIT